MNGMGEWSMVNGQFIFTHPLLTHDSPLTTAHSPFTIHHSPLTKKDPCKKIAGIRLL